MERSKLVIHILIAAILIGVLGDALLRAGPWSLNLGLWIVVIVAATLALAFHHRVDWPRGTAWLSLAALLFALGPVWRDSPALKALDVLAVAIALSIWSLTPDGLRIREWRITDYVRGLVNAAVAAAAGMAAVPREDLAWATAPHAPALRVTGRVLVGLLIAFPLLFVFGGLLMAADAVFEDVVIRALDFDLANLFTHTALTAFLAWIGCGFLILMLRVRGPLIGDSVRLGRPELGVIEVALPLALLDLLFLVFVIVQLRYLFGDASLIEGTVGLTYAEYARRGFFELVAVTALVLPLLLAADWLLGESARRARRVFQALAGVLLLLLFVIVVSAIQRMGLYVDAYGLTELRLYASAFMAWLAIVFAWFAGTVLLGRSEDFTFGAAVSAFLMLVALNAVNPDALIARVNVERARAGHELDAAYATSLSADAVPTLVAALPDLTPATRCAAAALLLKRWSPPEERDWRTWNRGRSQAWQRVEAEAPYLKAIACPAPAARDRAG